ncbi:hypothetical protein H0A72_00705 [Parapusillimonas granuli]|uniref:Uncharacterized protein n=1 Tax=Parapusillimonas granuli TaxID=380911 RepID=A0A853FYW8_9BURK|nr:hypothetical protein [Parapusillimonas granuli]
MVENHSGGGGSIAAQATAAAKPDGYTVLVAPIAVGAITPHLRKLPYAPLTEFAPVAQLSRFDAVVSSSSRHAGSRRRHLVRRLRAHGHAPGPHRRPGQADQGTQHQARLSAAPASKKIILAFKEFEADDSHPGTWMGGILTEFSLFTLLY